MPWSCVCSDDDLPPLFVLNVLIQLNAYVEGHGHFVGCNYWLFVRFTTQKSNG